MTSIGKIATDIILISILVGGVAFGVLFSINTGGTAAVSATGVLTFTGGNVTNGELVNITSGSNIYIFEFNTSAQGAAASCTTANCIVVNLTNSTTGGNPNNYNFSWLASGNLTNAINSNTSTSALVTATNTSNRTTITAVTAGTSGNSIGTTETLAFASWASSTLTGGTAEIPAWNALTIILWGFIAIIGVAAILIQLLKDIGIKIKM